jgi:hypothetical protein
MAVGKSPPRVQACRATQASRSKVKTGGLPLVLSGIQASEWGRRLLERTTDERLRSGTVCDLFAWAQRTLMWKDRAWVCLGAWAAASVSARRSSSCRPPLQNRSGRLRRRGKGGDGRAMAWTAMPSRAMAARADRQGPGLYSVTVDRWMNSPQELLMSARRLAGLCGHRPWLQS